MGRLGMLSAATDRTGAAALEIFGKQSRLPSNERRLPIAHGTLKITPARSCFLHRRLRFCQQRFGHAECCSGPLDVARVARLPLHAVTVSGQPQPFSLIGVRTFDIRAVGRHDARTT